MNLHFVKPLILVILLILSTGLFAQFAGGNGTSGSPYQVSTPEQLNLIRNYPTACFVLNNDIDLFNYLTPGGGGYNDGDRWMPIGDGTTLFRGTLSGNGHIISNLLINRPTSSNVGLFGYLGYGAVIQNVLLVNAIVKGFNATGALVGANRSGNIYYCGSLNGTVIGGAGWGIGGLVGFSGPEGRNYSFIKWSFSTGTVSGTNLAIGGLVGQLGEAIAMDAQVVDNCYSSATVNGGTTGNQVGGFIGCLSTAGWVINNYSTGNPTGGSNVGGFIGAMASILNLSNNNFWDTETSGTTSGGADGIYMPGTGSLPPQGRTTVQMKTQSNYTGWDFTTPVWHIAAANNSGYPHLYWQTVFAPNTPVAVTAGTVLTTSFNALWNLVTGATDYRLDVSTSSSFTSFVPGYNDLFCGNVSAQSVTGLAIGTTYYYRVRAENTYGSSHTSNTISVQTGYFDGTGSQSDPYRIYTAAELNNLRYFLGDSFVGIYFKLMNDIDLTAYLASDGPGYNAGAFWLPIGNATAKFRGQLDGDYYKISGLRIYRILTDYVGLFGYLGSNAAVRNLGIEVSSAGSVWGQNYAGGVAGYSDSPSTLDNVFVKGNVYGQLRIGGLTGFSLSNITNCYTQGEVGSVEYCGGIAASNGGSISNCYHTGYLSGLNRGGLVGISLGSGIVSNSYWDRETSSVNISSGSNNTYGKLTAEMQMQATYAGWDFTTPIWHIYTSVNQGYPHFAWEQHLPPAPVANAASNITKSSFTANWSSVQWATGYYLDVTTDNSFTAFLPGYNNASVGLVTSVNINGLDSGSNYYYRVRATNAFGTSGYSNPVTALTQDFNGSGTETDPYQITTAAELNKVRNYLGASYANVHFKLMNDIDLASYLANTGDGYNDGAFWLPIGSNTSPFYGKFNGDNRIITSLKINRPEVDFIGLFGYAYNGAMFNNLGVVIDAAGSVHGQSYVGGLLGWGKGCTISKCNVNGNVMGDVDTGGLIGYAYESTSVIQSHAAGSVSGTDNSTGGLIGFNWGSSITDCYAVNSVDGAIMVGGLVGYLANGTINNSYAIGAVGGTSASGGLVGEIWGSITAVCFSYWDVNTTGQTTSAGSDSTFGKTTAQMQMQATYVGWDYSTPIWHIAPGVNQDYPHLAWERYAPPIPVAVAASNLTTVNFSANWSPSHEATAYYLDVATDSNFTALVSGYSNAYVGLVTSVDINGLSPSSIYYYRVRASNAYGTSGNSNPVTALTRDFVGSGTEPDPYQITNAVELNKVRNYLGTGFTNTYFKLMNDIDLAPYLAVEGAGYNDGAFWLPIGDGTNMFRGNLNGDGHTISNLIINRPTISNVGLFGYLGYGATLQNVVLVNANVTGLNATGALVGANRSGNVYNCGSLNGTVNGGAGWSIGGLVGFCGPEGRNFSFIKSSFSTGSVTGSNVAIGGLVGQLGEAGARDAQVAENCFSLASVNGGATGNMVGGFVGSLAKAGWIINNYCTGTPTGATNVGGFAGAMASNLNLSNNNFWDTQASGTTNSGANGTYMAGTNSLPPQGRTTAQMKTRSNYTGWDFVGETANGTADIWAMSSEYNNGYPNLDGINLIQNLDIPQSVQATTTGNGIQLNWSDVAGANSYKIFSADSPEGPYTETAIGVTGTSWTQTMGDAKKFYLVKASTD